MTYVVGELGNFEGLHRRKFVEEILIKKYSLPLEWRDFSAEVISDPLPFLKTRSEWAGIWISRNISRQLLDHWPQLTTEVRESGVIDVLLKERETWWSRCLLREALRDLIIQHAPQLDTHSFAYLVGANEDTRLGASVAIQLGFRHLVWVVHDLVQAQVMLEQIQKKYFGLELSLLPDSELTFQPSNGSLLINTLGSHSQEPVLEDLPYLNFLKKEGLVVDLPFPEGLGQLIEEARHMGIRHLQGWEIVGLRDFLFLKSMMGQDFVISREDYLREWKSGL